MIIEIRAKNCYIFDKQIVFSMKADMRQKKLSSNVHRENNFNVLKTAGIYGSNNSGKTCIVKCIYSIRQILLNRKNISLIPNIFTDNKICELGVTFLYDGRKFLYDFKVDVNDWKFVYEKFAENIKDQYSNEKEEVWLLRDDEHDEYFSADDGVGRMLSLLAKDNLLIYLVDTGKFEKMNEMKQILTGFAEKIDILDMNTISQKHTIEILKKGSRNKDKVVDLIKNADLYLEKLEYVESDLEIDDTASDKKEEIVKKIPESVLNQLYLVSTYKGKEVPSIVFDSVGTQKIEALASYIIEGLEQGRVLVVDELDSSIHFKLTRAIVAMFNNELNTNAQLIFTVHDINLMDCKKLMRKEQIWFTHKDEDGVYVYSLADFKADDGVRDTSDIKEKYRKGVFGAVPEPDLINSLLDIKAGERRR